MKTDETKEEIGNGQRLIRIIEKMVGRHIRIGDGALGKAFQVLTNTTGLQRHSGIVEIFKKLAFQNCAVPNEGQPTTDSAFAFDITLATLESAQSLAEGLAFLDDIANLPPNSVTTNPNINWTKHPQHQVTDFTSTLQVVVGLAALDWYVPEMDVHENYLLYVQALEKLFTNGRKATVGSYAKFMWKTKGDPMEEISSKLAKVIWENSSGQTILMVLQALSIANILCVSNRTNRFIDAFAKEVAHKQVSNLSPNAVTKLLASHFLLPNYMRKE